jgi:diguanylate cyclase (GGDEF)-like protein
MIGARLTQRDLIVGEHAIRDVFARFFSFKAHSLYFPRPEDASPTASFGPNLDTAMHLPGERRVLTPLTHEGRLMGVFVARGAVLPAPKAMLPLLPRIGTMAMERLALAKAAVTDPVTGLSTGQALLTAMEREISLVQDRILPGSASLIDPTLTGQRGCFGLIILDLDYFRRVAAQYGFVLSETTLATVGEVLEGTRPEEAVAARLHDDLFALFVPGASATRCRELAENFRRELSRRTFPIPATGEAFSLTASAGYAVYPQDIRGGQFVAPLAEQSRLLARKAKKALAVAKDLGRDQVMPYNRILAEGGVVLETLPLSQVSVSLGRSVEAEAGQRFLVWSPRYEGASDIRRTDGERISGRYPTMVKGEIVLMEVRDELAFAEVTQVNDPSWAIEPGDRLLLAPDEAASDEAAPSATAPPRKDAISGLYGRRDFLRLLAADREKRQNFSLLALRLPDRPGEHDAGRPVEAIMAEAATVCRTVLGQDVLGGRSSSTGLLFYLPDREPESLRETAGNLVGALGERLGLEAAVGLAGYPFLDASRADVPDNCRKAVDHALLLPRGPRIAVFDSLSLTVSGDRQFAMGDIYAAMEEYKRALLADEHNTLARNSLGICLAKLGRLPQARAEFERVIAADAKNTMALYNLGCVRRRLGENAAARSAFQKCLRANPEHVYSLLRLGRMAEEAKRYAPALTYYKRALKTPDGPALTLRHLARLSLKRRRPDEAREYLHQALVHDPKDAFSLHLMARLYLEEGEDPAIAEAMARQSVALRPDRPEFWKELARALTAQGKTDEAGEAMARAEGL